jgi:predicted acyl esterase
MNKNWRELISQPKYGIEEERDIYVPMRDGVRMVVNIFKPDGRGKFQAIISLRPYV